MFHAESPARGWLEIRAVLSFSSEILADLAMRGWAISFLTLAFVAFSILFCFFLRKMYPS
jgi:hypothetical protein